MLNIIKIENYNRTLFPNIVDYYKDCYNKLELTYYEKFTIHNNILFLNGVEKEFRL